MKPIGKKIARGMTPQIKARVDARKLSPERVDEINRIDGERENARIAADSSRVMEKNKRYFAEMSHKDRIAFVENLRSQPRGEQAAQAWINAYGQP